jgi:general stress protein 26
MADIANSTDTQKLAENIKGIRIAMMTTLDPDGVLRSRPMATQEADFDGSLWFFTRSESAKVNSLGSDQHVNLAYADPNDNRWISVAGLGHLVLDKAKMKELWNPLLKAWFPDGLEDPQLGLIRVDVESAQLWDAPEGKLVTLIGFAKAALTGKPDDHAGHSEKINLETIHH